MTINMIHYHRNFSHMHVLILNSQYQTVKFGYYYNYNNTYFYKVDL